MFTHTPRRTLEYVIKQLSPVPNPERRQILSIAEIIVGHDYMLIVFPCSSSCPSMECLRSHLRFKNESPCVDEWTRLGDAFGSNDSIIDVRLRVGRNNVSIEMEQCMQAFFAGMEKNKCISMLQIDIYFIPNNNHSICLDIPNALFKTKIKSLELRNIRRQALTEIQAQYFTRWLQGISSLLSLNINFLVLTGYYTGPDRWSRVAPTDEIFLSILHQCNNINSLTLTCNSLTQCSLIASFLGDQTARGSIMNTLDIDVNCPIDSFRQRILDREREAFDQEQQFIEVIIEGLIGNTTLKVLHFDNYFRRRSYQNRLVDVHDSFAKVLCNTSSIENICNSNHTLLEITPDRCSRGIVENCLLLNKNCNKEQVKRAKIFKYYFIGEFSLSPFIAMSVSLLPSVLASISCETSWFRTSAVYKRPKLTQSAIYRMLKGNPDLCNVNSRIATVTSDNTNDRKRQKI